MNTAETEFLYSAPAMGLQVSAEPCVQAISERFCGRGLAYAVHAEAAEQERRERKTASLQPVAYRMSTLSESYISARYRHGKDMMSGGDLLEYFRDTRAMRTQNADFSCVCPADDAIFAGEEDKACVPAVRSTAVPSVRARIALLPGRIKALPAQAMEKMRASHTAWFDHTKADTSREARRFPLSALAAIFAVAMSLMLIVASSVMINQGESRVNTLKRELTAITGEVSELRSDLCMENDLFAIRDVAVNEYGMVSEEYIRMEYLSAGQADSVEVFEEEPEQTIGLSAILSALGIK
ncbi:MAG: hypothetical protein IJX80_08545 [Clostridia bacterium]|nr:hypothetical protein [Clostridia bacterium]